MSAFTSYIKNNHQLKTLVHWLLIPSGEARPRKWVRWFLNPFFHDKGKGAIIRRRTRMDVLPFNTFKLGACSVIEDFSTINNGVGDVIVGNNSLIGMGNVIIGPVEIGDNVIMAQNIVVSGLNHIYTDPDRPISQQGISTALIVIENDCWIGANAVITAGVTVGKHSIVAAGSVITKDTPPFSITAGNPGKVIKKYDFDMNKWMPVIS